MSPRRPRKPSTARQRRAASGEDERPLAAVGVSEIEERAYTILLDRPGAALPQLASACHLAQPRMLALLDGLELKGLVTHSPDRRRRYFPTPPDVAVEALILRRQEALQRARATAERLQHRARKARAGRGDDLRVVEIITGRESVGEIFNQIQRTAREEIVAFDRPPYVWSPTTVTNNVQFEAMARGVRVRAVYEHGALAVPGAPERIRSCMQAGEESRVAASVPLKLVAADRRIAMLPLDLLQPDGSVLLVRTSSLLDALYEVFEATWKRSTPISFDATGELGTDASQGQAEIEQLVPLLAAGLNDKTVAQQLGISQRTLGRRLDGLLGSLDARTRFQAGWLAALRASPRSG
jgi:DNA-binding MarR family transcriptional regulator